MEENYDERAAVKETYQSELEKRAEINESQYKNLSERQQEELKGRDEKIASIFKTSKEAVDEGLASNRRTFQETHEKEKKVLFKDRDDQVQQAKAENQRLRGAYDTELKQQKHKNELEVGAWNQKYMDMAKNNQESGQLRLESQTALFEESRNRLNDKYRKAFDGKNEKREMSNDAFRESVTGRINGQIRSRDSQISGLKERLNNQVAEGDRLRNLEQLHLRESFESNLQDVEAQKRELQESFQNLTHKRVGEAQRKNEEVLRQSSREHKSQMAMLNSQRGLDRKDLIESHKDEVETIQTLAEKRVQRIGSDHLETQKKLGDFYGDSIEQLRDNYSNKLVEQRDANLNNVSQTGKSLAKRFRDRELSLTNRIEALSKNYEEKIEKIKDDHQKEIKHIEVLYGQKFNEKDKNHKFEKDSLETKYETKMAQIEEQNQDRFDRLQRKHEEDIRSISTRYSRKA